jgi:hypothetical protein
MAADDWKKLIDRDPPGMGPITEGARLRTVQESVRYRGNVRISTGRFYTDEELRERRELALRTPLP